MDKIAKALKKLNPKEKIWVKAILLKINNNDFSNLEVKKLKGRQDIFRVRKGGIRIIYRIYKKNVYILTIERKSDTTYNLKI